MQFYVSVEISSELSRAEKRRGLFLVVAVGSRDIFPLLGLPFPG